MEKTLLGKIHLAQKTLDNSFKELQRLHHLAASQAIIIVIGWLARCKNKLTHSRYQITRKIRLQGDQARNELMSHLLSSDLCHSMIRMNPTAFLGLYDMLVKDGGLRPTLQVSVEEQVAKTLYLLGHNVSTLSYLSFFVVLVNQLFGIFIMYYEL